MSSSMEAGCAGAGAPERPRRGARDVRRRPRRKSVAPRRRRSIAGGEVDARIRRISTEAKAAAPLTLPSKHLRSDDKHAGPVNGTGDSTGVRVVPKGEWRRSLTSAFAQPSSNLRPRGMVSGRRTLTPREEASLRATSMSLRRSTEPTLNSAGEKDAIEGDDDDIFGHDVILSIMESRAAAKRRDWDCSEWLQGVMDSTEFEAFVISTVLVLILVLLAGEPISQHRLPTGHLIYPGLDIVQMVILCLFLIEMLLKGVVFGQGFLSLFGNAADLVFIVAGFTCQVLVFVYNSQPEGM